MLQCCTNSPNDTDQLPAVTSEGLETFGCQVNGANWIPKLGLAVFGAEPVLLFTPNFKDSSAMIYATNQTANPNTSFRFKFNHANHTGIMNDSDIISITYLSDNSKEGQNNYEFSNSKKSSMQIKLIRADWITRDTVITNNPKDTLISSVIVSSIFSGTLYNNKGDSVVIQNGRFDLSNLQQK